MYFSPYTGTTYNVSSCNCPSFSCATSSSLLMLTAGPRVSVSKMASHKEKDFCVLGLEVTRSVITVQRDFRARFRKDATHRNNITRWYRQFVVTGCFCKGKRPGRPRVTDDNIEFDYRVDVCRVTQGAHIEGL